MANYATNIFHARTENKTDLDKIEAFLDDTFSEFTNRYGDSVDAEFSSRWVYPEEEIKKLVESLEDKDKVYIVLFITFYWTYFPAKVIGCSNLANAGVPPRVSRKNLPLRLSSVFSRISLVRLFPPPFGGRKINPKGRKQVEQREIVTIKTKIKL